MVRLIFLLVAFFATSFIVRADTVGLSVDQTIFSFDLDPGAKKEFSVSIENISSMEEKMIAQVNDFIVGDNNSLASVTDQNQLNGMKGWISQDSAHWILQSKEKKNIAFTVEVPRDATIGSHYAMIMLKAFPQVDAANFQSTLVGGQVGVYVLINVKGKASGRGSLTRFNAPVITSDQSLITSEFENKGNIHYIPHGEIHVKNLITRNTQILKAEKHFVFPGKKYEFELKWKPGSLFGAYKAQAFFVDGNGGVHTAQRFMFGRLFFAALGALILICLACYWFIRNRKKRSHEAK